MDWLFEPVYAEIERRMQYPRVDKPELYDTVRRIEGEFLKGADANPDKVNRWLRMLGALAPDVLALTTAALLKIGTGLSPAIRRLAEKHIAEAVM